MLHVTFGPSSCGCVRQAMAELGRTDPVTYLFDDFSIGPLDVDLESRAAWFEERAFTGQFHELAEHNAEVFAETLAADDVTIWMSRHNAYERCGFLETVHRRDAPIHVVDIADHDMTTGIPIHDRTIHLAFAGVGPTRLLDKKLHDSPALLGDVARAAARSEWKRVAAENADLRVVESDQLLSVPISYFDEYITSFARDEWKSHSFVVGAAVGYAPEERTMSLNTDFVWDRLISLIESSVLEGEMCGERWDMRLSKVRRPAR